MAKSSHKEECSSTSTDQDSLKEKTPQTRSNLPTSLVISSDEELEKPAKKPKRKINGRILIVKFNPNFL